MITTNTRKPTVNAQYEQQGDYLISCIRTRDPKETHSEAQAISKDIN